MIEFEPTIDSSEIFAHDSEMCELSVDHNAIRRIKLTPGLIAKMTSPLEAPISAKPKASTALEIWDLPAQGQFHYQRKH